MQPSDLALYVAAGAAVLVGVALLFLALAGRLSRLHGLPAGKVVYSDTGPDRLASRSLHSQRYGLSGKPDYLLATRHGLVPVEVKPGRRDAEPRNSHLLQVLAYCLLLEETEGRPPPYGLLRYESGTFRVDYNAETRSYLLGVMKEMREAMAVSEVHRNHDQPGRCRACAYRPVCEESLWAET